MRFVLLVLPTEAAERQSQVMSILAMIFVAKGYG